MARIPPKDYRGLEELLKERAAHFDDGKRGFDWQMAHALRLTAQLAADIATELEEA